MKKKTKKINGENYLAMAVEDLLTKYINDKTNNKVTDDPQLASLKEKIIINILNKNRIL